MVMIAVAVIVMVAGVLLTGLARRLPDGASTTPS